MKLSIITACLPSCAKFLPKAASSIPDRLIVDSTIWQVEWVICFDGKFDNHTIQASCPVKVLESKDHIGISATRNRALSACQGDFILNLDADDVLIPTGLVKVAEQLTRNPNAGWAAGALLKDDGSFYPPLSAVSAKSWSASELVSNWTVPMAFHPGVAWMRKDLLLAVGAWPALQTMEDKLPIFLVSELAAGVTVPYATHVYNRHDSQVTTSSIHANAKEHALDFTCEVLSSKRRLLDSNAERVKPRKIV